MPRSNMYVPKLAFSEKWPAHPSLKPKPGRDSYGSWLKENRKSIYS